MYYRLFRLTLKREKLKFVTYKKSDRHTHFMKPTKNCIAYIKQIPYLFDTQIGTTHRKNIIHMKTARIYPQIFYFKSFGNNP